MRYLATLLLLSSVLFSTAEAGKKIIECRVIVGGMRECNPYTSKLFKAREVSYEQRKKLIVEKTLPAPAEKTHMKVISVADMIERYVKVEPSKRYVGTEKSYSDVIRVKKKVKKEEKKAEQPVVKPVVTAKDQNETVAPKPVVIPPHGVYRVKNGDTLSRIAMIFGVKSADIMHRNELKKKDMLRVGQKLILPFSQEIVDAIGSARYKVKETDTLISIAKRFNITPKKLAQYNNIKNSAQVHVGKILKLPLPYVLAEEKAHKKAQRSKKRKGYGSKFIRSFGKHRLRVTATAYTSHGSQTDKTPFLAAWNNRLRPGMRAIAVSRDLLYRYGMRNGTKVKIAGLPGIYRVRDKMNKRYKRRIDIYMGLNRRKALRWGRRSVVIYW